MRPGTASNPPRRTAAAGGLPVMTATVPTAAAVRLGGFEAVPGLVVLGHYGWQRWQDGDRKSVV